MANTKKALCSNKASSRDFIIRIFNDEKLGFKGKIEHIKTEQVQYFDDFFEMLMLIQHKLDEQIFPQCETELRVFNKKG